ncbi:Ff.00g015340.m01.CDS01 [Fusarium sp. VM40]|nr:Ff.00g015340.m01.CDS01 [Fusarium sp. VM40]
MPEGDPGQMFFQQASSLIPDILEDDSIRSIQACFILSAYLMPMNVVGTSYLYMGMALRKALSLGLHQNPDERLEERERESRRRLWWSIYSSERCTAIKLNRPRSVLSTSIEVPLPAPLQDLDRGQKFNNILLQIAYARLITIMDMAVDLESTTADDGINERVTSLEDNLKEWKNSLPEGFSLDAIPPSDSRYRAVFHLYLNYYYTRIIMGKASLIRIVRMTLRYHLGQDAQPWIIDDATEKLARSCKRASKKLLYLFEGLDETSGTTRSAFTYFQACSIATIVTLIAGILERGFGYQQRVDLGLGLLRGMAAGNPTAEMGVKLVESLQSISDEASRKLSLSRQPFGQPHNEEPLSASRYNDWTEWLANQGQPQADDDVFMQSAAALQPFVSSMMPSSSLMESEPATSLANDGGLSLRALGMLDSLMTRPSVQQPLLALQLDLPNFSHQTTDTDDDQAILMSLTGLDVLEFAALSSGAVE